MVASEGRVLAARLIEWQEYGDLKKHSARCDVVADVAVVFAVVVVVFADVAVVFDEVVVCCEIHASEKRVAGRELEEELHPSCSEFASEA